MEKEKMVRIAKALYRVFGIVKKVVAVCAVICVVALGLFAVVRCVHPDAAAGATFGLVHFGPFALQFAEEVAPHGDTLTLYACGMVAAGVAIIAVVCYAIDRIRNILAPMTQGNPFCPTVGAEIRRLAFACLAIGVIQNVMSVVEACLLLRIYDWDTLFANSHVESAAVNFLFDPGFLVVFFVLLLMSCIFQYGQELQKLSDETL